MTKPQIRTARALFHDESGNSLIEMAIILPFVILVIFGITDVAIAYSAQLKLEQVAQRSIEIVTGSGKVGSDYSYVKAEAAAASKVPISQITVDNWLECNRVRQASFDGVCPDGQATARYVSIDLYDFYNSLFGTSYFTSGSNYVAGKGYRISADALVRVQ